MGTQDPVVSPPTTPDTGMIGGATGIGPLPQPLTKAESPSIAVIKAILF